MKMNYNRWIYGPFIFVICAIIFGCIEEIDIEAEQTGGLIVIEGQLSNNQNQPYRLFIGITSDEKPFPVPQQGAITELVDSEGTRILYDELRPGRYLITDQTFSPVPGRSYHLEIRLSDGRLYKTIPEKFPEFTATDDPYFKVGTIKETSASGAILERPAVEVYTNTSVPAHESPIYLSWDIEQVYRFLPLSRDDCYIHEFPNPQEINLASVYETDEVEIKDNKLMKVRFQSHKFFYKSVFNVITETISENRYRYLENVDRLTNRSGTIFDVPPATIRGNAYNSNDEEELVLGYFEVTYSDTSRFYTASDDFRFPISSPCFSTPRHNWCFRQCPGTEQRPWYY